MSVINKNSGDKRASCTKCNLNILYLARERGSRGGSIIPRQLGRSVRMRICKHVFTTVYEGKRF